MTEDAWQIEASAVGVQDIPLLTTKLYAPPARPGPVPRPRLTQRLNEGLSRKLALISAPAGFGKTTLISE
jgi:LuxR family maltose regulon positive regulatory protein